MAIQLGELIEKLLEKDQFAEVEFIIVKTDGALICVDVDSAAKNMVDVLKLFGEK